MAALSGALAGRHVTVAPGTLGRLAARALRDEATLTPKPGLVDMRGGGSHDDMDVTMLLASADALAVPITRCAEAAASLPLGRDLRAEIGAIGLGWANSGCCTPPAGLTLTAARCGCSGCSQPAG